MNDIEKHDKATKGTVQKMTRGPTVSVSTIRRLILAVALMASMGSVYVAAEPPSAPANLTATGAAAKVNLSWTAVSDATEYRVSRGTASGNYNVFFDVGETTSYADTAVANGTKYFYVVAAKNARRMSVNSPETSVTPGTYTGAPFLISPAHDAKPLLGMSFEWSDPAVNSSYSFILADLATGTILYTTSLSATAGPCTSGTTCVFSPGMTGYPGPTVLDTRNLKWTVIGNNSGWALGGAGNYNYMHPILPEASGLVVNWTGNTVSLNWTASDGAVSYHASYMNWAFVTSNEMYAPASACAGAACAGTADVSQIPYGTVHVRLQVCGTNGACTEGITADAYKACPVPMPEPALLTPSQDAVVNGLTTVRWAEPTDAERYSIQFQKDEGGQSMTIVKDEAPWRSQITCEKRGLGVGATYCSRTYGLSDGNYVALVSAFCGGSWGPQRIVGFTVNLLSVPVAFVSPQILSPANGATTSITPVMLWSKIADITDYELVVTSNGGVQNAFSVSCKTPICAFDYAKLGLKI